MSRIVGAAYSTPTLKEWHGGTVRVMGPQFTPTAFGDASGSRFCPRTSKVSGGTSGMLLPLLCFGITNHHVSC
jgi:hypothetical protein